MALLYLERGSLPVQYGFRDGNQGTHTSRTVMIDDLRRLLAATPATAVRADYRRLIVEENILGKRTIATRKLSATRLGEIYGLDTGVILFRALRYFWDYDEAGKALLAGICAHARDPLLRMTSPVVLPTPVGEVVTTQQLYDALSLATGDRFNANILHKIARNASSSWEQTGHLVGRNTKTRHQATATPATTAYALLLGYLTGMRGLRLFETYWVSLLDANHDTIDTMAFAASRQGWLEYRRIGSVVDISFNMLLHTLGMEAIREQD